MGKNQKRKDAKKEKTIEDLKNELRTNKEIYKKNKDNHRAQVQQGLVKKGLPPQQLYDILLANYKIDVKELKIKIDSKFEVKTPFFAFEATPEWRAVQISRAERQLKDTQDNIDEIQKQVDSVESDIVEQNTRLEGRIPQIIEQLKELKADMSDIEKPAYIG